MTDHPDPQGEAAARVAQLAAMTLSVGEAMARLRSQRLHDRALSEQQNATALRAQQSAQETSDRLRFSRGVEDRWVRSSSTSELLDAWSTALPYLGREPLADLAVDRVEARLRQLHPEAMATYDAGRAGGFDRRDCLDVASTLWRGEYGLDPLGTPVAHDLGTRAMPEQALAEYERQQAAADLARPDLIATPTVDETETAAAEAAQHHGRAAAHDDGAALAFPVGIHEAMRTAPQAAARAIRALPPAPTRKQLTATPHQPTRSTR
jgi:hypothetical protein